MTGTTTTAPLNWPRDGREVLRVQARDRAYWKAANLAEFDGTRWVQGARRARQGVDNAAFDPRPSRLVAASSA